MTSASESKTAGAFTAVWVQWLTWHYRGVRCFWCGADALLVVGRTGTLSGHRHSDHSCERHAEGWLPREEWER
jgi:hypothetical protein